jgi:protoheme IX farnesyltransferase
MRKAGRTLFTYSLSYLFIIFLALITDRAASMLGWF